MLKSLYNCYFLADFKIFFLYFDPNVDNTEDGVSNFTELYYFLLISIFFQPHFFPESTRHNSKKYLFRLLWVQPSQKLN